MVTDRYGAFNLGSDGVLRSLANNLTVLDWRQLDPDQVLTLATDQLLSYKIAGQPIPSQLTDLISSHPVDGRNVTDLASLSTLDEVDRPAIPPRSLTERDNLSPNPAKRVVGQYTPQPIDMCLFFGCMRLQDCTTIGCRACFFPGGPPFGVCSSLG